MTAQHTPIPFIMLGNSAKAILFRKDINRHAAAAYPLIISGDKGSCFSLLADYVHTFQSQGEMATLNLEYYRGANEMHVWNALKEISSLYSTLYIEGCELLDESYRLLLLDWLFEQYKKKHPLRVVIAVSSVYEPLIKKTELGKKMQTISVPPLCERIEDLIILINALIDAGNVRYHKHISGIDLTLLAFFMAYTRTGNYEELSHAIDLAVLTCEHDRSMLESKDIPFTLKQLTGINETESEKNILHYLMQLHHDADTIARLLHTTREELEATYARHGILATR